MQCKWCGEETPDESGFCEHCGMRVEPSGADAPEPESTAMAVWLSMVEREERGAAGEPERSEGSETFGGPGEFGEPEASGEPGATGATGEPRELRAPMEFGEPGRSGSTGESEEPKASERPEHSGTPREFGAFSEPEWPEEPREPEASERPEQPGAFGMHEGHGAPEGDLGSTSAFEWPADGRRGFPAHASNRFAEVRAIAVSDDEYLVDYPSGPEQPQLGRAHVAVIAVIATLFAVAMVLLFCVIMMRVLGL